MFCVEFKIVLYQFLYRCGHFNLSLITNRTISDSFLEMCSPVKFAHSLSKKSRTVSSWELCIICQISCDDTLSKASEKGKCTLFKAVGLRKDDVHRRLHDEFDSFDLIPTDRIQYFRSCYESYTSKINFEKFEPVEVQMLNASACGSVRTSESICVKTRSMTAPFDWSQCIFCKQKSYKKDRNLKRVEFKDRVKNILHAANYKSDFDMVSLIQSVGNFLENALYHSSCIANYLLNMKSDTVPVEKESEHASAFQQFIDSIRDDLFVNKKAFSMSFLLDKFCFFLPPNIASKYATSKLQQKLLNYFGNAIIVEKQRGQGKSNTVFSSSITVSEAIHAANNLKAELKFTELETSFENTQSKSVRSV